MLKSEADGTRYTISTPALVLDLDALEGNIETMAERCRAARIALRPHIKSHKSSRIAHTQVSAGAIGVACATLDEAEVMVAAGLPSVLITSPIVGSAKMGRLAKLLPAAANLMVVVDNPANAAELYRMAREAGAQLPVLIDVDIGQRRTGVTSVDAALGLAGIVAESPYLRLAGLQAYGGHLQHIEQYDERRRRSEEAALLLRTVLSTLRDAGHPVPIVSGSGTGCHAIDAELGLYTEIQAGSYVFTDAEYRGIQLEPNGAYPFAPSLFVQATVISANIPGQIQTDAGTKAFALNGPPPPVLAGAPPGSTYTFLGDEHGCLKLGDHRDSVPIGSRIECLTPHCDPTVHLYDWYHCVRDSVLVDRWPIDARLRA